MSDASLVFGEECDRWYQAGVDAGLSGKSRDDQPYRSPIADLWWLRGYGFGEAARVISAVNATIAELLGERQR